MADPTSVLFGAFPNDPLTQGLVGYWKMDGSSTFSTTFGETSSAGNDDSGNGGLLLAQSASLANTATLQSLSFYVNTAVGDLQLGIYTDSSGAPGTLITSTSTFTPTTGWNTQSVTPTDLATGTYWLAYEPQNNGLHFPFFSGVGSYCYKSNTFGSMPSSFGGCTGGSGSGHWGFYGTVTGVAPVLTDSSGSGLTLTNNGTTTFVGGKFGNGSEHVPASTQYFSIASTINSIKSVSFWTNPDATTNYYASLTSGAYITSSSGTLSATGFTNPKIYVNGVETTTIAANVWSLVTVTTDTAINADTFYIGRQGSNYFDGTMDEVRLYNRTFSPSEIAQLYSFGPGPVGYWKMDEASWVADCGTNSVYDSSGNESTGTACPSSNGAKGGSTGKYGYAGSFDGNGDYVDMTNESYYDMSSSFTISTWLKRRSTGTVNQGVIGKNNNFSQAEGNFAMFFESARDGNLYCHFWAGGFTWVEIQTSDSTEDINDTDWHHTSCVYDFDTKIAKMYIDGIMVTSNTWTTQTPVTNNVNVRLGYYSTYYSSFNGYLDETKIYNYARTQKQIVEDMNAGHPAGGSPISSSIIYWNMDEQQGSTLHNSNSQQSSLTGTTSGTPWRLEDSVSGGCKLNGCLNFDSSTDTVTGGDTTFTDSLTGMSLSLWLNPQLPTVDDTIISKSTHSSQNSFLVRTDSTNSDEVRVYIASSVSDTANYFTTTNLDLTAAATYANWQQLTIVYNGSVAAADRVKVYKAGRPISGSVTGTIPTSLTSGSTSALRLGDSDIAGPEGLLTYIDEAKIYNFALTPAEILVDATAGSSSALGGVLGTHNKEGFSAGNPAIAIWKFDDNTGQTAIDTSTTNNDDSGTLTNMEASDWVTGKFSSALNFNVDGTDEYVDAGSSSDVDGSSNLSATAWVYIRNFTPSVHRIFRKSDLSTNGWTLGVIGSSSDCSSIDGTLVVQDGDGGASVCSSTVLSLNTWYHLALVRGAATSTLYINGEQVASGSQTFTSGDGENLLIGSTFEGIIDEAHFFKYPLNNTQLAYDYNRGHPAGYWDLDECSGTTANDTAYKPDRSSTKLTGTLSAGSGGGNTSVGTCNSGVSTEMWNNGTAGKFNSSLDFDGDSTAANADYVEMADDDLLDFPDAKDFAIEAWINRDTSGTNDAIVTKTSDIAGSVAGYALYIGSDDTVKFTVRESSGSDTVTISSIDTITATGWNHIVFVWDDDSGTDTKIYLNGKNVTSGTPSISLISNISTATVFRIGAESDGGNPLDGKIDTVKIYSYALTNDHIKRAYNEGAAVRFGPQTGSP